MAVTETKKKKPPTFHFLPKARAKKLKKSWVQDHKIRSKWKAQKKREGLTEQTNDNASHRRDGVDGSELETSPDRPDKSPTPISRDQHSLRDLRKTAYTSEPRHIPKAHSLPRSGRSTAGRETGQPNMKLRMNLLLEKIKRDFP